DYWIRPPQVLSARAGLHRFVWDLHYAPPPAAAPSYPISAVEHDTPQEPRGPWALPGTYTARLTVDGRTLSQPLRIKMDPRVKTSPEELRAQFDRSMDVVADLKRTREALDRLRVEKEKAAPGAAQEAVDARIKAVKDLDGRLVALYTVLQEADAAPT